MSGSSGEKTEEPTPKKLRDARKKGQVAKSNDINSTALLIIIFAYIGVIWNSLIRDLREMLILPSYYYDVPFFQALNNVWGGVITKFMTISFGILVVTAMTGILSNFIQVGPLLAFESLKPDFNKMNPVEGFKKIFAKKNFVEFLKNALKISAIVTILYYVIKDMIDPLFKIPLSGMAGVMEILPPMARNFAINILIVYIIFAIFDLFFQRKQHIEQLKMTKDEVKREYKEMEGDPQIKGQRKQLHREMAMEDAPQSAKKSTVVVTNPEHYAIALKYEEEKKKLPYITAKGKNLLALRMIDAAKEAEVPVMQNIDLAHKLYDDVPVKEYIPRELLEPVAEVLRWVREIKKEKG